MKSLMLVALVLGAALATASPHVETLFTIPLPITPAKKPVANYVSGHNFYVATKQGVTAVDLATKSILWNQNVTGSLDAVYSHGGMVFVRSWPFDVIALDAATGMQKWKTPLFFISPFLNITGRGDEIALITSSQVWVLNATNGAVKHTQKCDSLHVAWKSGGPYAGASATIRRSEKETADPALYCLQGEHRESKTITAYSLFGGTQLWASATKVNQLFWVFRGQYLVLTNGTSQDSSHNDVTVLDATNGKLKAFVADIPEIGGLGDGAPTLNGNTLTIICGGLFDARQVVINLATSTVTSNQKYNGTAVFGGYTLYADDIQTEFQVTSSLKINAVPKGQPSMQVCSFTPSMGSFNLQYYGAGVLQVGNLQGWVLFYIKDGNKQAVELARNEKSPGWRPSVAHYNGTYLFVVGNEVKGEKLVM